MGATQYKGTTAMGPASYLGITHAGATNRGINVAPATYKGARIAKAEWTGNNVKYAAFKGKNIHKAIPGRSIFRPATYHGVKK